jgi:hypothetical protein
MKNVSSKFLTAFACALMLVVSFSSCKDDNPDTPVVVNYIPVIDSTFAYTVDDNTVVFTTTLTGNVWFTGNSQTYTVTDGTVTATIAVAGTYPFTCSRVYNGLTYTSDTFNVVIAQTDPTLFNGLKWTYLTGGYNSTKTWVLDVEALSGVGPLSFLGTDWDFAAGANDATADDFWLWDAGPAWTFAAFPATRMCFPGDNGYGTMSFSLINGLTTFAANKNAVGTIVNGHGYTIEAATESGTYTFDTINGVINISGATILHSYKPYAFNVATGTTDTTWLDGNDGISDWSNYYVYAITDTTLRLAVSRDQDVQSEGKCWLIYTFISKEWADNYVAPVAETFTYSEPVNTSFTKDDLVGTWVYDQTIPQDWIGWTATGDQGTNTPSKRLNSWTTYDAMVTSLVSWSATTADSIFQANFLKTFVFNSDGSCTLAGVANTYSVSNGVITFGNALTTEMSLVWISVTGTTVPVLSVVNDSNGDAYTYSGIFIGNKNGDKNESSALHLVKQ